MILEPQRGSVISPGFPEPWGWEACHPTNPDGVVYSWLLWGRAVDHGKGRRSYATPLGLVCVGINKPRVWKTLGWVTKPSQGFQRG